MDSDILPDLGIAWGGVTLQYISIHIKTTQTVGINMKWERETEREIRKIERWEGVG